MKDEFKDDQLGTYGKRFARVIRVLNSGMMGRELESDSSKKNFY